MDLKSRIAMEKLSGLRLPRHFSQKMAFSSFMRALQCWTTCLVSPAYDFDQGPIWYTRPPPGLTLVLSGPLQSLARCKQSSASDCWYWKHRNWLLDQSVIQETALGRAVRAGKLGSRSARDTQHGGQWRESWNARATTGAVAASHGVSWQVLLDSLSAQSCCQGARSFVFWLFPYCISMVQLIPTVSMTSHSSLCL